MAEAGPAPLPLHLVETGKLRQMLMELAPWRSSKTTSHRDEDDPWCRSPARGGDFPPRGGQSGAAADRTRTEPERGLLAGCLGRFRGGGIKGLEFPVKEMLGLRKQSADNLLSSVGLAGGGRWGEGERCLRHLESSIFLFLPNFVGAEFADGRGREGVRPEPETRGWGKGQENPESEASLPL